MLKLQALTFGNVPRFPGLRASDLITIECDKPQEAMKDWRIIIRGATVFFVSPPGWTPGKTKREWKGDTVTVYEVPRADVNLQWGGSPDDIEQMLKGNNKWETPPLGLKPPSAVPEVLPGLAVPPGQMGDA